MSVRVCAAFIKVFSCGAIVAVAATQAFAQTALPGTIQAENFDEGGAQIAYVDSTPGNSGGQYRSTDVDIEATADIGGGYNLGWVYPGEWLNYTVNVGVTESYTLEFRVASAGAGGTFHLEANGVDVTGPLSVPDTGGWQSWATVTRSGVNLSAGTQIFRLVIDDAGISGAAGNFNYIRVALPGAPGNSTTPFGGTPVALPGTIQVEDFDDGDEGSAYHDLSVANSGGQYRSTAVDIEVTSDAAGGYNVAWIYSGEWLNYSVNVGSSGRYDLEARVASNGPGGTFHIEVNGVNASGTLTIPDTGGWQTWTTIRKTNLNLTAGQQAWRIVMDSNGAAGAVGNINFLRVVPATEQTAGRDVVLYASDATTIQGNWTRMPSSTGAEGQQMSSAADGWSSASEALASPADYFEVPFVPEANRAYRLWMRLRASGDSKYNDSVWVQFSGTVDSGGAPLWRIGTTSALLVNLERCSNCGVSAWGWSNRAWWLADDAIVRFPSSAPQQLRVQTREDGVTIDQIVLSPSIYFDAPPGAPYDDNTIVPKASSGTSNQGPTVAISNPSTGATYTAPATITIDAPAADSDGSIARVDFYAGPIPIGSATASPWRVTWTNVAAGTYSLTAIATDDLGATTTSTAVSITVNPPNQGQATTVVFTASPDQDDGVTSYTVSIYREGDPTTETPVALVDIGKPTPVNNDISWDISSIVDPLPTGMYYAVVIAVGPGGSAMSPPSAAFAK